MTPNFLYFASLAVYTFGAVSLTVLTAYYWRHRRRGSSANRSTVLPVFTVVCAIAFIDNLLSEAIVLPGGALVLIRNLATGLLPPLMLHQVMEVAPERLPGSVWRRVLIAFYAASAVSAMMRGANEAGLISAPALAGLYYTPAVALVISGLLGMIVLVLPGSPQQAIQHAHRRSLLIVEFLMFASAAANLVTEQPYLRQMPDYLVLAFFGVTLYFRERLAFIDLLVKRGAFFALGLLALAAWVPVREFSLYGTAALVLLLWLAGPTVYARIDRLIDSIWLRRRYSPADAEREFIRQIQPAGSEDELRQLASGSLDVIFRSTAEVHFEPGRLAKDDGPEDGSLAVRLHSERPAVSIVISPRPDGIPFLSDDRRLLQSLAGALGVVLENVHFREDQRRQMEREQQLRLLASRAELKALRAQINPHFLFNALSVITGLVQDRPELAAETIEELAQVFRYALRKSESEWVPLAEEVEFVTAYLRVEQARFGDRLKVDLHVDPAVGGVAIPAMTIQPVIENAIRHGISDQERGGHLTLRAALEGDLVSVEVFDTGPGFPANFGLEHCGEAHGLRNVMDRLRGYYGDAARLHWENAHDGTRVLLTFPKSVRCFVAGEKSR